jgi:hypothetical protein
LLCNGRKKNKQASTIVDDFEMDEILYFSGLVMDNKKVSWWGYPVYFVHTWTLF